MKKNLLFSILLLIASICRSQQTVMPTDLDWNNAVVNFNCVPDGVTDNTVNLRHAAQTYHNPYLSNIVVYLPKGTYLISDSIKFLSTFYDRNVTFIGEDSAQTIIRLKDNAAGFQDVANPRPMFETRAGNQAFGMYFKNLTINTGNNNPGAVGIDYITSNYGAIEHVRIVSPDASAYCGVLMERTWPGPGLLKNVTIDGGKYGIRVGTCEYSMTFENVTIRNQSICGLVNSCNTLAIRKLQTFNCPKAIQNGGRITLLDSRFENGLSTNYAIESTTPIFCRNITTTGFASALSANGTPVMGTSIVEYKSTPDYSVFANDGKSLNLPIEETPEYANNNLTDWAKVNSYGAQPTNPLFTVPTVFSRVGIQAAMNSGKKVIYFDRVGDNGSSYCIDADITIPASVEMIDGMHHAGLQFFNNSKLVINEYSPTPLFLDGIGSARVENNTQRTVVFKGNSLGEYLNTPANINGKVFLEDIGVVFKPPYPVRMWARHYNPEIQPELDTAIINRGGSFWILGLKTEGRACILSTYNGGKSEVLGGLVYPSSSFSGNTQVAFKVVDACMSITTLTRTSYVANGWFGITVQEIQNGVTRNFNTPGGNPFYDVQFFSSAKENCLTTLPIKLIDFAASCNKNEIAVQWKTESESNLQQFVLQSAIDGVNWTNEKTIVPKNQSASYQSNFAKQPATKFVRLLIEDKDGTKSYSKIVSLNCIDENVLFNAYPNPFTNNIRFLFANPTSPMLLRIKDVAGRIVASKIIPANMNSFSIDLHSISTGIYFAEINSLDGKQLGVRKIVKSE
jgi:Pectate lyase superfamily protein/Secretion system C-terminal sorting domain